MASKLKCRYIASTSLFARVVGMMFSVVLLSACGSSSFYHERLMRGAVVEVNQSSGQVVVCIGTERSVEIGSNFIAKRVKWIDAALEGDSAYELIDAGVVTLTEIIDIHFARGTVVRGEIAVHDILVFEPD